VSTRATARRTASARASARPATRPRAVPTRNRVSAPARRTQIRSAGRSVQARRRRRAWWLLVPVVALLLGGIVWVNVAKLTLTAETGAVVERARAVEAETVRLEAELERADAAVVDRARDQLDMVPARGDAVTYLTAPSPAP
jgi:hypothetical protein